MNKIIIAIVSLMVGALVFTASLPIFDALTTTTTAEYNEGMLDLRYDLVDSHKMYTIVIDYDEINDILTLTNGTDVQTFTGDNLEFFYADDNVSVMSADGFIFAVGKDTNDNVSYIGLDEVPITITRTNNGVSIECDGETYTYGAPTYAYIPLKTGKYATFLNGQVITTNSALKDAFFGYYAGVYTYNNLNTQNLGLYLNKSYDENDNLNGATWETTEPEEPAPDTLDIQPFEPGQIQLDPIDIDPGNNVIMSVPTPTYTDGDWGYDLDGDNAKIVSYSGSAGDITVPATVGGYTVTTLGKGSNSSNVFDTSLSDFTVTISNGIEVINNGAFNGCSGLTSITIPSSVTTIGTRAFYNCTGLTSITIPSSVTTIGNSTFYNCTGLTSIILENGIETIGTNSLEGCTGLTSITIPVSVTSIGESTFYNTGIAQVLNLSNVEITTTSYGLSADSVQDYIGCLVFIGNTEVITSIANDGPTYTFISMLPLIAVLGLVFVSIGVLLIRRI